jgi:hypothetical protein
MDVVEYYFLCEWLTVVWSRLELLKRQELVR